MTTCNALTLVGDGYARLVGEIGPAHVFPNKKSHFVLGPEPNGVRIPLGEYPMGKVPATNEDGAFRQAKPVFGPGKRILRLVAADDRDMKIVKLLRIQSDNLDFSAHPTLSEILMREMIWVGGEGAEIPAAQYGDRRYGGQDQLFAFREGDWIIVVSRDKTHIVVVSMEDGKLEIRDADEGDILAHIMRRAPLFSSIKEALWGLRVLNALGKRDAAGPVVEKMRKLSPGFVLDWLEVIRS